MQHFFKTILNCFCLFSPAWKNLHNIHDMLIVPHARLHQTAALPTRWRHTSAWPSSQLFAVETSAVCAVHRCHSRPDDLFHEASFLLSRHGIQLVLAVWVHHRLLESSLSLYGHLGLSRRTFNHRARLHSQKNEIKLSE